MSRVDLPIPIVVTRYKCPHCHRSRSKQTAAYEHMQRCWYNPAARGCKTCANYYPGDDGCGVYNPVCNCASPEMCRVSGIDLDGTLRVHCDSWESAAGRVTS